MPPAASDPPADSTHGRLDRFYQAVEGVLIGQRALIDRLLIGLLTDGHILLEGVPGLGKTLLVPESQQDACTALSGSGPAYFFYLVEAMTDAGILLGLPRDKAHDLIVQSAIGAAVMLRDSGEHPVKLRENVTSPAGTTISAIRELENHGVRAALIAALEAARDRSRELASGNS